MASTDAYTTGKLGLIEPGSGNYVDVWDQPLYANWQTLDAAVSGTTTINLTNSNVYLTVPTYPTYPNPPSTALSTQNMRLLLQGTLTANVSVYLPSSVGGFWIVDNQTVGAHSVTILTTAVGSTGVAVTQSFASIVYSNGTNVKYADIGGAIYAIENFVPQFPAGSINAFGGTTIPAGWLYCDGSSYSTTTYSNLFAAIGYIWGGSGANFNVPNLQSMFLRGAGGSYTGAVGSYQPDTYLNHNHTATSTDSGHNHGILNTGPNANGGGAGWLVNPQADTGLKTLTGYANITTTVATSTTGGSETRPKNMAVYYMIKY